MVLIVLSKNLATKEKFIPLGVFISAFPAVNPPNKELLRAYYNAWIKLANEVPSFGSITLSCITNALYENQNLKQLLKKEDYRRIKV